MAHQKVMSFDIVASQSLIWERLSKISTANQLGNAYLISGPRGCGKEGLAIRFSQLLNCEISSVNPCDSCPSCQRFHQLQHEKLNLIFPLPTVKKTTSDNSDDISTVGNSDMELVTSAIAKKSKDHFYKIQIPKANRILIQSVRGLRKSLYLKSDPSGRKIVLILDAHLLSAGQGEAANALLKILEEPPKNTTLVLVTDHVELLLPTILSRCQRLSVPRLNDETIMKWLQMKMVKESEIPFLAGLSLGNIHQARFLTSQPIGDLMKLISGLIKTITGNEPDSWRKFIQTYSRLASQDPATFSFHFMMIKIWFRSANRLQKDVDDILHETSFKLGMKRILDLHPTADFSAITFELENTILAIPKNLYIPLILTNLLIKIQKYLKS
ncbi:MAG: AAA family ATPase [Candidatus Marinimicrobia bacterium]|jgi:DNA polymerase-3 subunit delta'|nr:AAA family ATPase [Candidatus Neomarinimicrobiota bacterium]MBT4282143.1 AAA family ATPase [Candidatus Neomarinimicrobiota bacterium]MBT4578882.1 AAA family ATPase [Candidatus Neomarinimicrobiota bacterium]MBT4956350.1 AAA family ATPase [Candidatus Neomarinimicrobiota bacterium]MBT5362927.1 AAA family ATPase [Candidatus Neomarinimicrobiota bacterium]